MDHQAVIETITALKGLGVWSAEIYLVFSLQRPDIFPASRLGTAYNVTKTEMAGTMTRRRAGIRGSKILGTLP